MAKPTDLPLLPFSICTAARAPRPLFSDHRVSGNRPQCSGNSQEARPLQKLARYQTTHLERAVDVVIGQ